MMKNAILLTLFVCLCYQVQAKHFFVTANGGTALFSELGPVLTTGIAPGLSVHAYAGYIPLKRLRVGLFADATRLQGKTTIAYSSLSVPIGEQEVTAILAAPCTSVGVRADFAAIARKSFFLYAGIFYGHATAQNAYPEKPGLDKLSLPGWHKGHVMGLTVTAEKQLNRTLMVNASVTPREYDMDNEGWALTLPVITLGIGARF